MLATGEGPPGREGRSAALLPRLLGTATQVKVAGGHSVETLPTLVLPFVVEDDSDDNGKDGKHQREKDDEKEGQAAEGRQRGCH